MILLVIVGYFLIGFILSLLTVYIYNNWFYSPKLWGEQDMFTPEESACIVIFWPIAAPLLFIGGFYSLIVWLCKQGIKMIMKD